MKLNVIGICYWALFSPKIKFYCCVSQRSIPNDFIYLRVFKLGFRSRPEERFTGLDDCVDADPVTGLLGPAVSS